MKPTKLANALIDEEEWRQVLSSLVVCFFARGIYDIDTVVRSLATSGFQIKPEDLQRIGHEILLAKQSFKRREGFESKQLRLPKRIFETPSTGKPFDEGYLRQGIAAAEKHWS